MSDITLDTLNAKLDALKADVDALVANQPHYSDIAKWLKLNWHRLVPVAIVVIQVWHLYAPAETKMAVKDKTAVAAAVVSTLATNAVFQATIQDAVGQ